MSTESMREEFLAWVRDRGCDTDGAWSAWQAATLRMEESQKELVEALQEILRVHANDTIRPKAFYIAADALAKATAPASKAEGADLDIPVEMRGLRGFPCPRLDELLLKARSK